MKILSTKRLILRNIKEDDFEVIYEKIFSNPKVVAHTYGKELFSKQQAFEFLKSNANFNSNIGLSVLAKKETDEIIGLSGVIPNSILGQDDFEIGFILEEKSWKQGYAKEIGFGQLEFIKNILKKPRALALASPENKSSIKTIENLSFNYIKDVETKLGTRLIFVKNF